ncbi:MAG: 1-(5-phosphoribosyl)-5-[(5-phosphoribosylamino)methylideneamino]imidazole-4-carboxamide isomerase [Gaiellaceae bacterium]
MWFDLTIDVIPAVDVLGGEAVRLERGAFDAVVERSPDPCDLAARWVELGARRIHLVDLDGARRGGVRTGLVEQIAALGVPVQASGGIRSLDDARALLDAGADRVVVGTAAWPDPTPWLELGESLVLAVDVRDGVVRSAGWTESTGISFAEALARAAGSRVLVTAIDRDGTLAGPDVKLVRQAAAAGLRVLAAGGVRSSEDVDALAAAGAEAAIVGRALLAVRRPG